MESFKEICENYFGTSNFYEVLGIKSTASDKEIKKAYHKLSLIVHPDRVEEHQKKVATEKFKVLGKIHSILQNKEKRKCYDDTGEIDDDNDWACNWREYWRAMFKTIDLKDIQDYEKKYIGSETEIKDIKMSYIKTEGDMDKMLEYIPFSNCDSEPRYHKIIQELIDRGELEKYDRFFNEPLKKKQKRRAKWEKEKKLYEDEECCELRKKMQKKNDEQYNNLIKTLEEKYSTKKKPIKTSVSKRSKISKKK